MYNPVGTGTFFAQVHKKHVFCIYWIAACEEAIGDLCGQCETEQKRFRAAEKSSLSLFSPCHQEDSFTGIIILPYIDEGQEATDRKMRLHEENAFDFAFNGAEPKEL